MIVWDDESWAYADKLVAAKDVGDTRGWRIPPNIARLGAKQIAIHVVLHDWFLALENKTAAQRLPDPSYPKAYTEAQLEALCRSIDEYIIDSPQRNWAKINRGIEADAGPGYLRLQPAQRLAFAQDLHQTVARFPEVDEQPITPEYFDGSFD